MVSSAYLVVHYGLKNEGNITVLIHVFFERLWRKELWMQMGTQVAKPASTENVGEEDDLQIGRLNGH